MGITQSAGTEHNVYWNIGHLLGNEFEDIIDHLSKSRNNIQKLKSTITKYHNKLSYLKKIK